MNGLEHNFGRWHIVNRFTGVIIGRYFSLESAKLEHYRRDLRTCDIVDSKSGAVQSPRPAEFGPAEPDSAVNSPADN